MKSAAAGLVCGVGLLLLSPFAGWLRDHAPALLLLLMTGALLNSSALFVTMGPPLPASGRLVALGVWASAQIVAVAWLLGITRHLWVQNVLAAHALALIVACLLTALRAPSTDALRRFTAGMNLRWLRDDPLTLALLLLVAVNAALALWAHLPQPPTNIDSLTYHLAFPAGWLVSGELRSGYQPYGSDPAPPFYPFNGELINLWLLLPLRSDLLAKGSQLFAFLLAFAALYAVSREAGLRQRLALRAALLLGATPATFGVITDSGNDMTAAAFFLTAVYFLLRLWRHWERGHGLLAMMAWALFVSTKYLCLAYQAALLLLLIAVLADRRRQRKEEKQHATRNTQYVSRFRALLAVSATVSVFTLCGGFAYWRNALLTANPVYPATVAVAGVTLFEGLYRPSELAGEHNRLQRQRHPRFPFEVEALGAFGWHILPVALLGVVAVLWTVGRQSREGWTPVALAAAPMVALGIFQRTSPHHDYRLLLVVVVALFGAFAQLRAQVGQWDNGALEGTKSGYRRRLVQVGDALWMVALILPFLRSDAWTLPSLRAASRYELWQQHPTYREPAKAWQWLEERTQRRPHVIAYVGTTPPYPLYGSHLRNTVLFVPRNRFTGAAFIGFGYEIADARVNADEAAWLDNLRHYRVDYLFVSVFYEQERWPQEVHWAEEGVHRDLFERVYARGNQRIYRFGRG